MFCWILLSAQLFGQQFFFSAEKPATCSSTDGIITIVPTQGVPPFTYNWNTGGTEVTLKNIPKGVYTATLTDAFGSTVVHTHFLNSLEHDIDLIDAKPSTFCNPTSGALTVSALTGVAPFTYSWSDGQSTAAAVGLVVGTYTVTVQDATGCTAEGEYEVKQPSFNYYPQAGISLESEPNCSNLTAGSLSGYMGNSGYLPNTYAWSNGATTETINNLTAGAYTLTITDALGCLRITNIDLRKQLDVTGSVVCNGQNTGTASANLVGATGPVSYTWSNGQTGPNLSNLTINYYQVTATDANGCSSVNGANVIVPSVSMYNNNIKCFTGNNGQASLWTYGDTPTSILWDNGVTDYYNTTLSPGAHTVTVTTSLGCILVTPFTIDPPIAPPFQINYSATPGNCLTGAGGAMNVSITGGTPNYSFYAYGPNNFFSSSINSLQNIASGDYYLQVYSNASGCSAYTTANVPDASGFNPELVVEDIDCNISFGSAAVMNVTTPGAQYNWSVGSTNPAIFNLTNGCYSVSVTAGSTCVKFYEFCLPFDDSLQISNSCLALVSGKLIDDQGVPGCTGTTGIPYQMIRTLPSGALNFTDENGDYTVGLPSGAFDIEPASYDLNDILCPVGGFYTVNANAGTNVNGLDFHFYNSNPIDHRVRQRALRTSQPGYPYSLRVEVCNDGATVNNGTLDLEYGNFLTNFTASQFAQHPGAFTLNNETMGSPNNNANYSFPGIAVGACELLQVDFLTPTTVPVNTPFQTKATVSPSSGDPTPDNNISNQLSTVMGSFDPNSVLAFPARNGNPRDGGEILQNTDKKITYQIFFQNTGNAPADLVVVRDTLDAQLDVTTIRNITTTHDMRVSFENDNQVLVFKFPNINLPDSTSDYANSIGSIQYDIDVKPGLIVGDEINKHAAIFFDFNPPVITNNNLLKIVNTSVTQNPVSQGKTMVTFPNPTDEYFSFYLDTTATVTVYNNLGDIVAQETKEKGLQNVSTLALPNGLYMVRFDTGGKILNSKVVVSHP
jgi:uncharacterized repeat protein (TIGR01451 family)